MKKMPTRHDVHVDDMTWGQVIRFCGLHDFLKILIKYFKGEC